MFWVLICTVHLTVCSCHVTYAFQSESPLYRFLNVNEPLAGSTREIWRWGDYNWTQTQNRLVLKRTVNHLVNWPNDRTVYWVLICTLHLILRSFHVTYAFQSESTLYSCLNVNELLARSRWEIWRWSDCNWTGTQNHLVLRRTLNHLAKLAKWSSSTLSTYLYGAFDCMCLSCHVRVSEWIHTLELHECQGTPCSKQARNLRVRWLQLDSNPKPLSS